MAATSYTYSLSGDFPADKVAEDRLAKEIADSGITSATYTYTNTRGDDCLIWFDGPLSVGDETLLDGVVAAHSGEPLLFVYVVDGVVESSGLSVVEGAAPAQAGDIRLVSGSVQIRDSVGTINPRTFVATHKASHEPGGNDALAVDAAAGTGSLRTLGTGATAACAGSDARLSDTRDPKTHKTSHEPGGGDALAVDAAAGTGSLRTLGSGATNACAGNDSRLSNARTPTAHKASHEPGGGDAMSVDAVAGTGSLRTLGTGATSACAGNDSRLSNARTPTSHASTHQNGGGDEVATATAGANVIPKAGAGGKLDIGFVPTGSTGTTVCIGNDARLSDARTPTAHKASHEPGGGDALTVDAVAGTGSLRTLGTGAQQACSGSDARLSNARTPTAHASSHQPGGGDAMTVDAVAGTGSLRTLGTGAQQACSGSDARLSDARTPSAHATSHKHGGADEVATATAAANAIPKAGAGAKLDVGWVPTGSTGTTVCVGNDSRLSDARTPTAHKASHEPGGGDALAVDAVAGTGSLRTLGTSATSACAGNDSRLSDNRTDANAIHKAVSGEISAMTEKTSLVSADVFVIEDSAASFAKKKVQVTNLPGGVDTTAIHKATAGEIAAMTEKATPVAADLIVIEDSAAANAKKKVQIGNLPGGTGGGLKTKAGTVALTSFSGDPPSYAVTFAQAFVDANYSITFGSNRGTPFTWTSKTTAGFTIVRHSAATGTNMTCDWIAVKHGES